MKISIEYCNQWGYRPRAASLADKIENQFPAKVELIPSSGGVYEIVVDQNLIYSKKATGQFPAEEAILEMLGNSQF